MLGVDFCYQFLISECSDVWLTSTFLIAKEKNLMITVKNLFSLELLRKQKHRVYMILSPKGSRIIVSRDMVFEENKS